VRGGGQGGCRLVLTFCINSTRAEMGDDFHSEDAFKFRWAQGTLAPSLVTVRPVRSPSARRWPVTPCAAPAPLPTRGMRCSSRPPYLRSSRFFWVPSGLGSRFSWCLVRTVPSASRFCNATSE